MSIRPAAAVLFSLIGLNNVLQKALWMNQLEGWHKTDQLAHEIVCRPAVFDGL
jgi:hypothetical protein